MRIHARDAAHTASRTRTQQRIGKAYVCVSICMRMFMYARVYASATAHRHICAYVLCMCAVYSAIYRMCMFHVSVYTLCVSVYTLCVTVYMFVFLCLWCMYVLCLSVLFICCVSLHCVYVLCLCITYVYCLCRYVNMYLRIHMLVCYYMYVLYGYGICMRLCIVYAYIC